MAGVGARLAQQAGPSVGRLVRAQGAALARFRHPRRAGHAQLARLPHGVVARALLLGPRQAAQEQPPEPHPRPWPGGAYIRRGGAGRGGMGERKPYGLYAMATLMAANLFMLHRHLKRVEKEQALISDRLEVEDSASLSTSEAIKDDSLPKMLEDDTFEIADEREDNGVQNPVETAAARDSIVSQDSRVSSEENIGNAIVSPPEHVNDNGTDSMPEMLQS